MVLKQIIVLNSGCMLASLGTQNKTLIPDQLTRKSSHGFQAVVFLSGSQVIFTCTQGGKHSSRLSTGKVLCWWFSCCGNDNTTSLMCLLNIPCQIPLLAW